MNYCPGRSGGPFKTFRKAPDSLVPSSGLHTRPGWQEHVSGDRGAQLLLQWPGLVGWGRGGAVHTCVHDLLELLAEL